MRTLVLLAISMLTGCATSKEIYLPDGTVGTNIDCSGTAGSWNMCYDKAGKLCGAAGYEEIDRTEEQGGFAINGQYTPTITRNLIIKCN